MNTEETTKRPRGKNQVKVYQYLQQFAGEYLTPTEIGKGTKMMYSTSVCSALKRLVEDGFIKKGVEGYKYTAPGLGIEARNPGGIEADSPAGTATPKESNFNPMNQETKQLTAAQHLEEVRIYGRRLSEFLLPDQVKFLEEALKRYAHAAIEEQLKVAAEEAKSEDAPFHSHKADKQSILNCTRIELK